MPSALEIIRQELPKWWREQRRPDEISLPDVVDMVVPQTPSDVALTALGGPFGKLAKGALGTFAASSYSPEAEAGSMGGLGKMMRLLQQHGNPNWVKPAPPVMKKYSVDGQVVYAMKDPKSNASGTAMFHPNLLLPDETRTAFPKARAFELDTTSTGGGGDSLYNSIYHNAANKNWAKLPAFALTDRNKVRMNVNMGRAGAEGADLRRSPFNEEQNMYNISGLADLTKKYWPQEAPEHMTAGVYHHLTPDERTGYHGLQQLLATEQNLRRLSHLDNDFLLKQGGISPEDFGYFRKDAEMSKYGDREPALSIGKRTIDDSQKYMEALSLPDSAINDLVMKHFKFDNID